MAEKEFQKLNRRELLELLLLQREDADQARAARDEALAALAQMQEDFDRLKQKLDDKDIQMGHLKERLDEKDEQLTRLKGKLAAKDTEIQELQESLETQESVRFDPDVGAVVEFINTTLYSAQLLLGKISHVPASQSYEAYEAQMRKTFGAPNGSQSGISVTKKDSPAESSQE